MPAADVLERTPGSHCSQEPRRDLRIRRVERRDHVFKQREARAIGAVELSLVGREGADQRTHPIGIGEREGVVVHEAPHALQRLALGYLRLERKPFVEDKRLGGVAPAKRVERPFAPVVGLEGDVTPGKNRLAVTACTTPDGCWTPAHDSFTTINHLTGTAAGHLRARVGIASGPSLFYAAGGYSLRRARLDLLGECFNPGDPATPLLFTFSRSKTMSGFNLGAGYERQIGRHFAVRAEYLYDDFGNQLFRGDAAEWNDRRIAVRSSTFRVGANLRF